MGDVLGLSTTKLNDFFNTFLKIEFNLLTLIDILITAALIYWIYVFLKKTRAISILYGLAILALIWLLGQVLHLSALNFILRYFITITAVAIPVVFQPELRSLLEKIGRSSKIADYYLNKKDDSLHFVQNFVDALTNLKKQGIGALIIFERKTGLKELIDNGVIINSTFSSQLLLTIFSKGTPLHDGATIIRDKRIIASSVMIPLLDTLPLNSYGMRHRAALAITSETDALAVVVSEEKRQISIAYEGNLKKNLSIDELTRILKRELFSDKS